MLFKNFLVLIPLLSFSLTCCANNSYKTYGDVFREDMYLEWQEVYDKRGWTPSDIEITKTYILHNGALTFNVGLYNRFGFESEIYCTKMTRYGEEITFSSDSWQPYVWYKHKIYLLTHFFNECKGVYSKDEFLKIKDIEEHHKNNFQLLQKRYVEQDNESTQLT